MFHWLYLCYIVIKNCNKELIADSFPLNTLKNNNS